MVFFKAPLKRLVSEFFSLGCCCVSWVVYRLYIEETLACDSNVVMLRLTMFLASYFFAYAA